MSAVQIRPPLPDLLNIINRFTISAVATIFANTLHTRCTILTLFVSSRDRTKFAGKTGMPKLSPRSVTLLDGAIVLSRRDGSAKWQARFKNGSRWIRVTTKKKDLDDAKEAARELYMDARYRVKHGIPAQSKRFKDVARLAVDRMEKAMAAGEGKRVYRDYVQAITTTSFRFSAHHSTTSLTRLFKSFRLGVPKRCGSKPKSSTINTYNSALNRIFDEALMRGYIAKTQIPILENRGRDGQRRPDLLLTNIANSIVPYANGFMKVEQANRGICANCFATMF